jgi:gas vesicle protein
LGMGALLGILFAPQSGEETREYLAGRAEEGRDYAQRKARELREQAEDMIERGKERAEDLLERSKELAARQKESISAAVEAGKEAYQREKAKS